MADFTEVFTGVVVCTSHMTQDLAEQLEDVASSSGSRFEEGIRFVFQKYDYGYQLWTGSDENEWPEIIRPLMVKARDDGHRWVFFDCDGPEVEGFQTWEW